MCVAIRLRGFRMVGTVGQGLIEDEGAHRIFIRRWMEMIQLKKLFDEQSPQGNRI